MQEEGRKGRVSITVLKYTTDQCLFKSMVIAFKDSEAVRHFIVVCDIRMYGTSDVDVIPCRYDNLYGERERGSCDAHMLYYGSQQVCLARPK